MHLYPEHAVVFPTNHNNNELCIRWWRRWRDELRAAGHWCFCASVRHLFLNPSIIIHQNSFNLLYSKLSLIIQRLISNLILNILIIVILSLSDYFFSNKFIWKSEPQCTFLFTVPIAVRPHRTCSGGSEIFLFCTRYAELFLIIMLT